MAQRVVLGCHFDSRENMIKLNCQKVNSKRGRLERERK